MPFRKKQVGDYLLCDSVGEGQRSLVRTAVHLPSEEKVIVKCYEKINDGGIQWRQLRAEVRQLSHLNHDNILTLLEAMETEHGYYMAFEEAPNGRLDQVPSSLLNMEFVSRIFSEILGVISFLHRRGLMCGNLKMSSCLLDRSYSVKVKGLHHCAALGGPADYPASLVSQIKKAVDVWSLGAILLRLITNKLGPQGAAGRPQRSLQGTDFFIPSAIPKDLEDLLRRMLDTNPVTRITVPDIYRHAWCQAHSVQGPLLVRTDRPLAADLVREVAQRYGVGEEEVRTSVLGCRADHLAATYVLLRRRVLTGRGLPLLRAPPERSSSTPEPSPEEPSPASVSFAAETSTLSPDASSVLDPSLMGPPLPAASSRPNFRFCLHKLREKARSQRLLNGASTSSEPGGPPSLLGVASERSVVLSRLTAPEHLHQHACDSPAITMPSAYSSSVTTPSPTASRRYYGAAGRSGVPNSCLMCRAEDATSPQLIRQKRAALRLASRNPTELYATLSRRYGPRFIKDPNKIRAVELYSRQMMMEHEGTEAGETRPGLGLSDDTLLLGLRTPPPPPNSRLQTRCSRLSSAASREPSAPPIGHASALQAKNELNSNLKRSSTMRDLKAPSTRTFQWTHQRAVNAL